MPLALATPSPKITVHTVLAAECTLDPIECIHCGDDENVTFNSGLGDAHCSTCGEWQLEGLEEREAQDAPASSN